VQQDNHPRHIQIAGRTIRCNSVEDRALLLQAKSIESDPAAADAMGIGRLHSIKDACQRYSAGKAQRLVNLAIVRLERSAAR
jgi:hypothetical protein